MARLGALANRPGLKGDGRPPVYFHAGVGRAASRWLQESVFPHFRGVRYVGRKRFRRAVREINRDDSTPVLVSRQLGYREFEPTVRDFAAAVPQAQPLLVIRRHADWIRSMYLREIKELRPVELPEFVDIEGEAGVRPWSSVRFKHRIDVLDEYFDHRTRVFLFDDLLEDPVGFVEEIASEVGASVDPSVVSVTPINRSYSDKQYRFLRAVGNAMAARRSGFGAGAHPHTPRRAWLRIRLRRAAWHVALAGARMVPEKRLDPTPLFCQKELDRIGEFFEDDWRAAVARARDRTRSIPNVAGGPSENLGKAAARG